MAASDTAYQKDVSVLIAERQSIVDRMTWQSEACRVAFITAKFKLREYKASGSEESLLQAVRDMQRAYDEFDALSQTLTAVQNWLEVLLTSHAERST
jgi:hypothetical protein